MPQYWDYWTQRETNLVWSRIEAGRNVENGGVVTDIFRDLVPATIAVCWFVRYIYLRIIYIIDEIYETAI